jgi:hypothetical protein
MSACIKLITVLADPQCLADLPVAQSKRVPQPKHLAHLPHRQSLRWHRSPLLVVAGVPDSIVDGNAVQAVLICRPQSSDSCPPSFGPVSALRRIPQLGPAHLAGRHAAATDCLATLRKAALNKGRSRGERAYCSALRRPRGGILE